MHYNRINNAFLLNACSYMTFFFVVFLITDRVLMNRLANNDNPARYLLKITMKHIHILPPFHSATTFSRWFSFQFLFTFQTETIQCTRLFGRKFPKVITIAVARILTNQNTRAWRCGHTYVYQPNVQVVTTITSDLSEYLIK